MILNVLLPASARNIWTTHIVWLVLKLASIEDGVLTANIARGGCLFATDSTVTLTSLSLFILVFVKLPEK